MNTHSIQLEVPLSFNQLIGLVRQLSPKEKVQLGRILWDETDEQDIDIPVEHQQIVMQRLQRMREHPESCLSWEDIENSINL